MSHGTRGANGSSGSHNEAPIRVAIVGDVVLHREGLVRILVADVRLIVCGVSASCPDTPGWVNERLPDVVVLDTAAPATVARAIRKAAPATPVIAIAAGETDDEVVRCAAAGISAYVTPEISTSEFVVTLAGIARGELPCCRQIASALMRRAQSLAVGSATGGSLGPLTPREREIVDLVARGFSNKEIAGLLYIQLATVKTHVHHVLDKLRLTRRGEIAAQVQSATWRNGDGGNAVPIPQVGARV